MARTAAPVVFVATVVAALLAVNAGWSPGTTTSTTAAMMTTTSTTTTTAAAAAVVAVAATTTKTAATAETTPTTTTTTTWTATTARATLTASAAPAAATLPVAQRRAPSSAAPAALSYRALACHDDDLSPRVTAAAYDASTAFHFRFQHVRVADAQLPFNNTACAATVAHGWLVSSRACAEAHQRAALAATATASSLAPRGVLFVELPKSGSTSVRALLDRCAHASGYDRGASLAKLSAAAFSARFSRASFTVVREPYARFVAGFAELYTSSSRALNAWLRATPDADVWTRRTPHAHYRPPSAAEHWPSAHVEHVLDALLSMRAAVEHGHVHHVLPQVFFASDVDGVPRALTHIVRLERVADEWPAIGEWLWQLGVRVRDDERAAMLAAAAAAAAAADNKNNKNNKNKNKNNNKNNNSNNDDDDDALDAAERRAIATLRVDAPRLVRNDSRALLRSLPHAYRTDATTHKAHIAEQLRFFLEHVASTSLRQRVCRTLLMRDAVCYGYALPAWCGPRPAYVDDSDNVDDDNDNATGHSLSSSSAANPLVYPLPSEMLRLRRRLLSADEARPLVRTE